MRVMSRRADEATRDYNTIFFYTHYSWRRTHPNKFLWRHLIDPADLWRYQDDDDAAEQN